MTIAEHVARPLLAGIFVTGGFDAVRDPGSKVAAADPVADAIGRPLETVDLVRMNGAVQLAAGSLLAIGRWPRLSAAVLAVSLVPTTFAGHRFWREHDDRTRAQQRAHFLKNIGLFGGLVLSATDHEGRPSLRWRIDHRHKSRVHHAVKTSAPRRRHAPGGGGIAAHQIAQWGQGVVIPETQKIVERAVSALSPAVSG